MEMRKLIASLLLATSVVVQTGTAVAADENIIVADTATQTASTTVSAAKPKNDITLNASDQNMRIECPDEYGTYATFHFTVKHNKNKSGRAVIEVLNPFYNNEEIWDSKTIQIAAYSSKKKSYSFKCKITGIAAEYTMRTYTQVKKNGKWVNDSEVHEYKFTVVPTMLLSTYHNKVVMECQFTYGDREDGPHIVYRKIGNGEYEELPVNDFNWTYFEENPTNGTEYTFYAKANTLGYWITGNEYKYYFLSEPSAPQVTNSADGKSMTISWDKNSEASGYEVQYGFRYTEEEDKPTPFYSSLNYKKVLESPMKRTVKSNAKTSITLTKRTAGKQYWVQVRSYKTVDGVKYYSSWSDATARYAEN